VSGIAQQDTASGAELVDEAFMRRAMALAQKGLGATSPNPMVGAVVVRDGEIVGEGWHEAGPGTPHAEPRALEAAGAAARGATLYVTLEPCNHTGRTPACAPAVAAAGIARVVAGTRDPSPLVDGRGFAALRDAGVAVDVGVLQRPARDLIAGFAKHSVTGVPYVVLKLAASLDGKTAAADGSSRWITGEAARHEVHVLRARAGAVIVGSGTAVADDPSLTVRLDGYTGRQPLRVLVDGSGRTPATNRIFDGSAPALVATTTAVQAAAREGWERAGAEILTFEPAPTGVPLRPLIEALGKRDVQEVLIEGGSRLAASVLVEEVADRLVLYVAPKVVGGVSTPGLVGGTGAATIADALGVRIESVAMLGEDVRITAVAHQEEDERVYGDR
jgi:diaminohydroxyphosphoribosylaminopyrimidine deaminase/5-amino-6-(5-phosphoribosylamino)uracil reductase